MSEASEWRVWAAGAGGLAAGLALGCAAARRGCSPLRAEGGGAVGKVWAVGAGGIAAGLALGCAVARHQCQSLLHHTAEKSSGARKSAAAGKPDTARHGGASESPRAAGESGASAPPLCGQWSTEDRRPRGKTAAAAQARGDLADLLRIFSQLPARRLGGGGEKTAQAGARAVFAVASGKGGVGKSTVAVNLAYALQGLGLTVGVVDIDIHGPSLPELVPMPPDSLFATEDGMIIPFDYGGVGLMSWGYVQPGIAATIRAPIATKCVSQLLQMVRWGELDCLIVDTPPGTGDVLLTLTQTLQIDGAVLVTTGNEMSIADLEKGVQMFEKVDIPTLAVCQNMAAIACEHCGAESDLFCDPAAGRIPRLLESYPEAQLHRIPLDAQLSMAPTGPTPPQLQACPYVRNPSYESRPASRALRGLAEGLLAAFLAARPRHGKRSELRLRPGGTLELRLPGGDLRPVPCAELRAACRCAECVDEFSGKQLLDREKVLRDSSLRATAASPVGNYGVQVKFSDGHSSLLALKMIERLVGDTGSRQAKDTW